MEKSADALLWPSLRAFADEPAARRSSCVGERSIKLYWGTRLPYHGLSGGPRWSLSNATNDHEKNEHCYRRVSNRGHFLVRSWCLALCHHEERF